MATHVYILKVASSKPGRLTLGAVALGAVLFYSLDWIWLRELTVRAVTWGLGVMGIDYTVENLCIHVPNKTSAITRSCTYAELMLYAAPFLWRQRSLGKNLAVVCLACLLIFGVNTLRLLFCIVEEMSGISRFLAHDLPDILLWYGSLAVIILFWYRNQCSQLKGADC